MCHERNASILNARRPLLLLVQYYDRGIFPLLRYAPALPYGDHISVKLFKYTAVTIAISIYGEFEQFSGKLIGSNSL